MSFGFKDELFNLKSKLKCLEAESTNQLMELEVYAKECHKRDEGILDQIRQNKDKIFNLIIGNKIFQTKLETFMFLKDKLFYKILSSGKLD